MSQKLLASLAVAALLSGCATPSPTTSSVATASPVSPDAKVSKQLVQVALLLKAKRSSEAVVVLDAMISDLENRYRSAGVRAYSARSNTETLAYALEAANAKTPARVYPHEWGDAYFLKGYALIESGRLPEAKSALDAAIALSPRNSRYLAERAHIEQVEHNWSAGLAMFRETVGAAEFTPPELKTRELSRALRGVGFAQTELNQFDEAEATYRQALALDPADAVSLRELQYINSLRSARQANTAMRTPPSFPENPNGSPAPTLSGSFEKIWSDATAQNADSQVTSYLREWTSFRTWNDGDGLKIPPWPDRKAIAECVTAILPSPRSTRLVFTIDASGKVVDAATDQPGYIADCIKQKTIGLRIPAPPRAPFLMCTRFEAIAEEKTVVSGCGTPRRVELCERKGAGSSCIVQFR